MFKRMSSTLCGPFAVVSQWMNILRVLVNSFPVLVVFGSFCREWHICAYNNVKCSRDFILKCHNTMNSV